MGFKDNLRIQQAEIYAMGHGELSENKLEMDMRETFDLSKETTRAIIREAKYKRKNGFKKEKSFEYKFKGKDRNKFIFVFRNKGE